MREKINCNCGRVCTWNTFSNHLKSSTCSLDVHKKTPLLEILALKTTQPWAWRIKEGEEATRDTSYFQSLLKGESILSDWTFTSPRKVGQNRKSQYEKSSNNRMGSQNPSVKCLKFEFSKDEVVEYIAEVFDTTQKDTALSFGKILKEVELKYPKFKFLLSDDVDSKRTYDYVKLGVDISIERWKTLCSTRRGLAIQKGQLASPFCREQASLMASNLIKSGWRISVPHRILYSLIKSVDTEVQIESRVKHGNRYFSYDIYSPSINAFIEMHGALWHTDDDQYKDNKFLYSKIQKNLLNDKTKEQIAKENGKQLLVFWDNQISEWSGVIERVYGKQPISIQEAANQVSEIIGTPLCIRFRNGDKSQLYFRKWRRSPQLQGA